MQLAQPQVKTLLADGIHVAGYGNLCASTSYESNVPFVLRFMVRIAAGLKRNDFSSFPTGHNIDVGDELCVWDSA